MSEEPRPRVRRRLGVGRLLLFSGVTFLLFLLGLEGALRVLAAGQGPQHHLGSDGALAAPDPAAFRVVAVGDSWVYGAESEPHEAFIEVFRRQAAARLNRPVQVFNLGVSASNSSQALLALAGIIDTARPHLVVALTGANNLLHDQGVADAARLMGEDARMVRGLTALSSLRTVRLARLLWVTLVASSAPADLGAGGGEGAVGASAVGTAGLPTAPPVHTTAIVRLPWWSLYEGRWFAEGLALVVATPRPPVGSPLLGVWLAWQALFRAHLGEEGLAEQLADEALLVGGDDAVAHEARAVLADRRGTPLFAFRHRLRAATAPGHPFIQERARGLVLLEVEAWEAAAAWLLSVQHAAPGDFASLLGLARLPPVVRNAEIEALLFEGPRGQLLPLEYFAWHLASSGRVDRALGSLDRERDPQEPGEIGLARARGAELAGATDEALLEFRALLESPDAVTAAGAAAGVLRLVRDPAVVQAALGATPAQLLARRPRPPPALGLALSAWFREADRCPEAIDAALGAIDAGALPSDAEVAAGRCMPGELGWALSEMAIARDPPIDRATLILGRPAPSPIPAPAFPRWPDLRDRRLDRTTDAPVEWRALAAALDGTPEVARGLVAIARRSSAGDPAVLDLADGLAHRREGRGFDALVAFARAAEAPPTSDGWSRVLARGLGAVAAREWTDAQEHLLRVVAVAPGQLEALEGLAEVPDALRFPATDAALRFAPSGLVSAERWVAWYLGQSRETEAGLALRWSWSEAGSDGEARAVVAQAQVERARGELDAARVTLLGAVQALAVGGHAVTERPVLCAALTLRASIAGTGVAEGELIDLLARCPDHPPAWAVAGKARARAGECEATTRRVRGAFDRGADPALLVDWMEPCVTRPLMLSWLDERLARIADAPPLARAWLRARIAPPSAVVTPADAAPPTDLLVRELDAMDRVARTQGARFVALTYPFPSGHHARVRETVLAGSAARGYPVLDLYAWFERRYSPQAWQALRTPQDHVNAEGYAAIGAQLVEWAATQGLLPPPRESTGG